MGSVQLPMIARIARWIVTIHVLALAIQIAAAIFFVSGVGRLFFAHSSLSVAVCLMGVIQAIVLFIPISPKIGKMYLAFASIVAIGELAQLRVGPMGETALHVTLGMIIWGCSLAIFIRLLDPDWGAAASPESA